MSIRTWTSVGALCCAALVCASGCQKDRLQEQEPGASRPIVRRPSPTVRHLLPLDSWSPDTEAMFGIDVAQFRKSPMGELVDNWLRTFVSSPAGCEDDIVEHVSQVLVVMNSASSESPIYVLRGVSRSQAEGCTSQASVWLDDATLVLAPNSEQATLDAAVADKDRRTNPRVLAAVSNTDTSAALWVAAATPPGEKDWMEDFNELRGTIVLDGGLRASFNLKYRDPAKASSAAEDFERTVKDIPPFSTYFELVRAHADGPWLQTSMVMSRVQLERFSTDPMFSGLFPSPPETNLVVADD